MTSPTPRSVARYGWTPDLPDARDHMYAAPRAALASLPAKTDLRAGLPDCYDQGQIGSCTANAIAGAFEFALRKQGLADIMPSRLFIYYNERAMEGHVGTDSGAQIRDGVKSIAKQGVCPETEWPYEAIPADANGNFPPGSREATKPSDACYQDALKNRATTYQRMTATLDQLRGCLAAGYPFVFGFTVYESFESQAVAQSGVVPMPAPSEQVLGGHAVLAVGYDDSTRRFLVRNSWGTGWGQNGYFTMPYAYLTESSLSSDFWTVRVVTWAEAPKRPGRRAGPLFLGSTHLSPRPARRSPSAAGGRVFVSTVNEIVYVDTAPPARLLVAECDRALMPLIERRRASNVVRALVADSGPLALAHQVSEDLEASPSSLASTNSPT